MARYYFDIDDDQYSIADTHGSDFSSPEAARQEAIVIATSIARDIFPSGVGARVSVSVRDEQDRLFTATVAMQLTAEAGDRKP